MIAEIIEVASVEDVLESNVVRSFHSESVELCLAVVAAIRRVGPISFNFEFVGTDRDVARPQFHGQLPRLLVFTGRERFGLCCERETPFAEDFDGYGEEISGVHSP